jgi:hypothetical protein
MNDGTLSPENLAIVLNGLLSSGDAERQATYRQWADTPACRGAVSAIQNCKLDEFYFSLIYPFKQLVNGLLQDTVPGQRSAHFLLMHYDFVRAQFRRIIEMREGFACCADKTRTILSRLLAFYISGKPIAFDPQEAYTYHHPRTVFTTHEAILEFFEALCHLHAGNPVPYLEAIKNLAGSSQEPSSADETGGKR